LTLPGADDNIWKMRILSFLGYLVLIGVGLSAIILSLKMYRQYRLKYLLYYFYSIIFSYAFGFLDIVAKYLTQGIFDCRTTAPHVIMTIGLAFSFIAAPFIVAAWFYLIHMMLAWIKKDFKRIYKIGYFILQGLLIVIFALIVDNYASTKGAQSPELSESILFIFNAVNRGILILVLLKISLDAKNIYEPDSKRAVRVFATIYISVFILHFVLVHLIAQEGFVCQLYAVAEFFMHIPPLLYLKNFLNRYYKNHPLHPIKENDLPGFFDKFGITWREQEIIRLILEGKSNREIEDELYISYTTVKTHIYNIYKKLDVKSRWQLINFIQNYQTRDSV
jgi:DNA-binding CsgD family transcriptional regulator